MHLTVLGIVKMTLLIGRKSEAFKLAHKNAGQHKDIYIGHPVFEGFNVVI